MQETSATIIDFSAYKARKQVVSTSRGSRPLERVSDMAAINFYFFWPIIAWMPVGVLLAPTTVEDVM